MSISDFILAILIIAGITCILWIMDVHPYSNKLQVYNQTCTNMILDNTYCKGEWLDNPVITYQVDKNNNVISANVENTDTMINYSNCTISDRKNWSCINEINGEVIQATDGQMSYQNIEVSDIRQITRFKWLQNKLLKIVNS